MARPTLADADRRDHRVQVSLNDEELRQLDERRSGRRRATALRELALNTPTPLEPETPTANSVIIDGIHYVPRAEIPPIDDSRLETALRELVAIQYFYPDGGKPRALAWDALNALAPDLADLCGASMADKAWRRLHPDEDD